MRNATSVVKTLRAVPIFPLPAAEYEATSQLHHGIHQSVFMSSMVSPPVKDLPLCWEQHAKLLPGIHKHSAQEVSAWNVHQVADFISSLPGCKDLVRVFLEEVSFNIGNFG